MGGGSIFMVYIQDEYAIIAYPSIKINTGKKIWKSLVQQSQNLKTIHFLKKYF